VQYISPEMAAFKPEYKSKPEGYWTWGSVIMAGIAYNSKNTTEAEAPKKWEDLLDPKWADAINVKVSNSGLQHGVWFMLKPLLGDDYFKKFATQKPRAFDSYVQQYGRLVDGQDKVIMGAQYSGYIEFKAKGAPLAFVFPETGVPSVPETYGIVDQAPHPNAAELFMDWFLSPVGQKALAEALLLHSPRSDVPPPGGADTVPLAKMKLLSPADWNDFEKDRPSFAKEWNRIVGAGR
jgi:iron(III) transport system substrate-binding protein